MTKISELLSTRKRAVFIAIAFVLAVILIAIFTEIFKDRTSDTDVNTLDIVSVSELFNTSDSITIEFSDEIVGSSAVISVLDNYYTDFFSDISYTDSSIVINIGPDWYTLYQPEMLSFTISIDGKNGSKLSDKYVDLNVSITPNDIEAIEEGVNYDPIAPYLPYDTDFYTVEMVNGFDAEQGGTLRIVVWTSPRLDIVATPEKIAEYKVEVEDWLGALGLDANKYSLVASY